MSKILWLLALQGILGACDTLWYHEWRTRLPNLRTARPELRLHAARDFIYCVIFATLPWVAWHGWWAGLLALLILVEIFITMADFVVEDDVRRAVGGVSGGERIMHALMGLVYGAILAYLVPVLWDWWQQPTAFVAASAPVPEWLRWLLAAMAVGVLLSGLRDFYAARRLR